MNKRQFQNTAVVSAAIGAAIFSVYTNTNWLSKNRSSIELERCYHIVRAGKNDCATSKHSCALQATRNNDPEEFIMLPKGLCNRIVGGEGA